MNPHVRETVADSVRVWLPREVRAEWTRQASLRSTWWCVVAAVAGMAVFGGLMGYTELTRILENAVEADPESYTRLTSQGVFYLVQFAVLALAVVVTAGEFANGSVTSTLLATPRRGRLLVARTVVTGGLAGVAGTVAVLVGAGAAAGFVGVHAGVDVAGSVTTAVRTGACMALFAVLFVGVAAVLRSVPGTLAVGFLLLLGLPLVMQLSGNQLIDDLAALFPGTAGVEFYAAGDVGFYTAPYDGAVNVWVVVGWAVAAQIMAWTELRLRDV